ERRSESPRNFIERVNLLMRALDLVVGHVGAALASLGHVHFRQLERLARIPGRQLLRQPGGGNLRFEARQVLNKQVHDVWVKMIAGSAHQESESFVASHAAT